MRKTSHPSARTALPHLLVRRTKNRSLACRFACLEGAKRKLRVHTESVFTMTRQPNFSDIKQIAALAQCDARTVVAYLAGEPVLRKSHSRRRIAAALAALGLDAPPSAPAPVALASLHQ